MICIKYTRWNKNFIWITRDISTVKNKRKHGSISKVGIIHGEKICYAV